MQKKVIDQVPFKLCRYHTLHHSEQDCNFCLFMPIYDLFGNTLNNKSWEFQKRIRQNTGFATIHNLFMICTQHIYILLFFL